MIRTKTISTLILTILLLASIFGQVTAQNPFFQSDTADQQTTNETEEENIERFREIAPSSNGFSLWIQETSNSFQRSIASYARQMQEEHWGYGLLAFLVAVLFGIVHIIGPGHGKIFTVSYFTSRKAKLKEGLWLSVLINVLDSISAFLVVGLGYFVLNISIGQFTSDAGRILQIVSYGIIIVLAVIHLISHINPGKEHGHSHDHHAHNPHSHEHVHNHSHHGHLEHSDGHSHVQVADKKGIKPWQLALSVGLVPCPVSTILLTYGIANNLLGFSLLLVLGVSMGGIITMSLLSITIIKGKDGLQRVLKGKHAEKIMLGVEWASSLVLVAFALILLISNLL